MTEKSRLKQIKTNKERYGEDHYRNMAKKRWEKPGAKDSITKDEKGKFIRNNNNKST